MVEVASTLMLLSIVMTFVYAGVDTAQKAITGVSARTINIDEARTLMAVTTKDLRTATRLKPGNPAITAALPKDVTFYANLNNTTGGPRKIRIYIDASNTLIANMWLPDSTSVAPDYTYTGVPLVRYVGQYVNNSATQPIFEYFGSDGSVQLPQPLSAANLLAIDSVRVTLSVRKQTSLPVRSVTLINQVRLPNVDYQEPGT